MWGFLVALISGALMSIQGVFNTEMTKQTSLWVSTGWVQFSAFLVCVLAWIFTGRDSIGALWQVENKYTLLGGIIGAFITITVIQSMGSLGPAKAAMLIVISQLAGAYVIELFGLYAIMASAFDCPIPLNVESCPASAVFRLIRGSSPAPSPKLPVSLSTVPDGFSTELP